jgi:hypothetical protein
VSEGSGDYTEDHMTLEVIAKVVPPVLGSIMSMPSVKAVWDSIIMCNVDVDQVHKEKMSSLKCEFDLISFHDGESVDGFCSRIGRIVNQLAVLGFKY